MSMQSREKNTGFKRIVQYILLFIFKITFGLYLRIRYRIRLLPGSRVRIKGPYLLLCNHLSNYDGLFAQYYLRQPAHFVITDAVFKNNRLRPLLSLMGYIPKKKFVSDARAIRMIIRSVKGKSPVGIFPEGARSWDGKSLDTSKTTARLVRRLGIPVVAARISGSYFHAPRWADTKRRGLVEIEMRVILSAQDIPRMDIKDIEDRLSLALRHNEFDWQSERMIPYKGKALAEGIERLLYLCPECRGIGTLRSSGGDICCASCGAHYRIDEFGFIHSVKGYLPSNRPDVLNEWQYGELKRIIGAVAEDDIIIADTGAHILAAKSDEAPFSETARGDVRLYRKRLMAGGMSFDIEDIYGLSVYFKSGLSFRHGKCDYRIRFDDPRVSVYKWCKAIGALKGMPREEGF